MNFISYKSILSLIMTITLSLPLSVFAIDINVSARVPGCGDGVVEPGLGEQCEIGNLNGQSCASQGFQSGLLSCTSACTFDTTMCSNTPVAQQGGSSSTGRRVPFNTAPLSPSIPSNNVIFSGRTEPGAWVIILNMKKYFASAQANQEGFFIATVSNFPKGVYDFSFYGLSSTIGLTGPEYFSIDLQEGVTTKIYNIVLDEREDEPTEKENKHKEGQKIPGGFLQEEAPRESPVTLDNFFQGLTQAQPSSGEIPKRLIGEVNKLAESHSQKTPFAQSPKRFGEKFNFFAASLAPPHRTFLSYPNVYFSFLTAYIVLAAYLVDKIEK